MFHSLGSRLTGIEFSPRVDFRAELLSLQSASNALLSQKLLFVEDPKTRQKQIRFGDGVSHRTSASAAYLLTVRAN